MNNLSQTFTKTLQKNHIQNKYDQTLDMLTATIYHACKKQFHSFKCAILIRRHVNTIPCLKDVDIKKIGMLELKRKLSTLPMERILILEYQLDLIEGLEDPVFTFHD